MNNFFPEKVKLACQALLKKLAAWKKAGHLSPRLWGGALLLVVCLILLTQSHIIFRSAPAARESPMEFQRVTPQPVVTPIGYEPLADTEALATIEIVPLKATVTPIAQLAIVTPLPPMPSPSPTRPLTFHTVQAGETLISIAAEYGITTEAILVANDIRDPTRLEVGQQLLIPPHGGLRMPVVSHKVKPGDELLRIAAKYGSSVRDILAANPKLRPDSLTPGQIVAVPIIFSQVIPAPQFAGSSEDMYYVVQRGDIPLAIAEEFDVPVQILLAANDITDPTRLRIGRRLLIPRYEGITLGFPVILYELEDHDTLLSIASEYGSSVKDILAVNPKLIPSSMQPGQVLAIPIIFPPPKPTPRPEEVPVRKIEPPPPLVDFQEQMVEIVNAERQAHGLPPYLPDEQLANIALAHAQDMIVRDFLSHVTPDGKTVRDRFEAQGVTDAFRVGENIQRNTRSKSITVQSALDWFMNSRPHRVNILHQHYNRIGVGIVESPPGWYTFVLNFAQR